MTQGKQPEVSPTETIERDRLLEGYRAILDELPEAVSLFDPSGRVLYHNAASLTLHGYANLAEALVPHSQPTERWEIRALTGEPVPIEQWPRQRVLRGESFSDYELHIRRPVTHTDMIASYNGRLVYDASDKPLYGMLIVRDVTQRRQQETALRQSEQRYHDLFTNMSQAFVLAEVIYDSEGKPIDYRCIEVNANFTQLTGIPREQAIGRTSRELNTDVNAERMEYYQQAARTGQPVEFIYNHKDLGCWLRMSIYTPQPGHLAFLLTDITAQKQVEAEREQMLAVRTAVMESITDGLMLTDLQGNLIYQNPASLDIHGYSRDHQRSAPMHADPLQHWEMRTLDGQPVPLQDWPWQRTLRGESFTGYEMQVRSLDSDREFTASYDGRLVHNAAGKPIFSLLVIHDITIQKRAEEALRQSEAAAYRSLLELESIYRNAPVGLCVLDTELRFIRLNQRMAEINGASIEEHLGKTPWEVVPNLGEQGAASLRRVLETGEPLLNLQVSGVTPAQSGVVRHWNENWSPLRGADGVISGVIVVVEEITGRKQADLERERLLSDLQAQRALAEQAREEATRRASEAEESQRLLEALMAYLPEGITIASGPDMQIRMVSRYGQELLGSPHSEMTVHEVVTEWQVLAPDGKTPLSEEELPLVRAIRRGEVVINQELLQVNTIGRAIPLLCNAAPLYDPAGNITGGIVAWRDITQLKAAEVALRESEEKYRRLFNHMSEGFALHEIILDEGGRPVDYRYLEMNDRFTELTGIRREQALGRTVREILPGIEPHWIETFGRVALTGQPARLEDYAADLGRWYQALAYSPRPGQFAVVFLDVTERRRSEQELNANLRDTHLLQELGSRLVSEGKLEILVDEILDTAIAITHADAGTVQFLDEQETALQLLVTRGFGPDMIQRFGRVPADSATSCGMALSTGKRVCVAYDAGPDPNEEARLHMQAGYHAAQSTPLVTRAGKKVGMLSTHWVERGRRPTEHEQRYLDLLARQAADLIERVRTQEALRLSEERFRLSALIAPTILAHCDREARYTWIHNPHPDYAATDVIGRRDDEIDDREDLRRLTALKRRVIDTGIGVRTEVTFHLSSGARIFDMFLEPLRNPEGHVEGVVSAAFDITERVQFTEALADAHAAISRERNRLQSVLDILPIGVAILDEKGGIEQANQVYTEIWGDPIPNTEAIDDYAAFQAWWPDSGRPVQPDEWAAAQAVLHGKAVLRQEIRIQRFDGQQAWVLNSGVPIRDEQGRVSGSAVAIMDISEQKQAEAELQTAKARAEQERNRLQAVMDALPVGVAFLSLDGKVSQVNATFNTIWGLPSFEAWQNEDGLQQRHAAWWASSGKSVEREEWASHLVRQHKKAVLGQELRIQRFDGQGAYVLNSAAPVLDEQGEIAGSVVAVMDISAQKAAEEALREARDVLEQRVDERTAELAAASAAERRQRQFAEALGAAALLLNQSLDRNTVLATILQEVRSVIPYTYANIGVLESDADPLRAAASGKRARQPMVHFPVRSDSSQSTTHGRYSLGHFPLVERIHRTGQPVRIEDTRTEPDWLPTEQYSWCRSYLAAPLVSEGRVIGLINLFSDQPGFFSQEMSNHLVAFAAHASAAIRNAELFEQVRASSDRLQSLSRRLVEIQESERHYIARELHDEAGQMLTFLILDLGMLEKRVQEPEAVLFKIEELKTRLKEVLENLHRVAMALRPASLDHLGLVPALRAHVQSIGDRNALKVSFKASGMKTRLDPGAETAIYRIVQEALTNVVRHANASQVDVVLNVRQKKLVVIIEDDGIGFNPEKAPEGRRLGLVGMRERAEMIGGRLLVESAPGQGTIIMVEVDYPMARAPEAGETESESNRGSG